MTQNKKVTKPLPLLPLGIAVGALIIAVAGFLIWQTANSKLEFPDLEVATELPRKHVKNAKYFSFPPMGGDHNVQWQNCGVYEQPIKDENAVHSLEHGAVWIAYRPDIDSQQRQALVKFSLGRPYILLAPYPRLEAPITILAWGHRIKMQKINQDILARFTQKFAGSLKAPEPAGPCIGGIGNPRW